MRVEWKKKNFTEMMGPIRQDWIDGQLKMYLYAFIHDVDSFSSPLKISWNKINYAKISGQEIATRCEQETSNLSILMKM